MTTVKVKFRASTVADREGTIYYQIIHERKQRRIYPGYHLMPSEWDASRSKVATKPTIGRPLHLKSIRDRIRWDLDRLNRIIRRFENEWDEYSADDIVEEFNRYSSNCSLFNFMERIILHLRQNGKIRTSETYSSTLKSFKKFRNDEDLMLEALTSEIMEAYEAWHRLRGNTPNTISFYTRILRAAYRRAVEDELIEDHHPFRRVYTGVDKTVKRALPIAAIRRIKELDLSLIPEQDYARDMFLLSFMLRGMSFVDMTFLKKTDLKNGSITYRRRKTGQQLTIAWTGEMQRIIEKYGENDSDYLLPIIRRGDANERCVYHNVGANINRNLKRVARKAGIAIPLTLYVARHSWASAAKSKGIPLAVISEGMGHDSETTTRIYLASLDTSVVDKANALIISSI